MEQPPALVFVHHFRGTPKSVSRQVRALPMLWPERERPSVHRPHLPATDALFSPRLLLRSLWDRWTDGLEAALQADGIIRSDQVTRPIWFFSQSMPGHAVLQLLARNASLARATNGWIADGGPFLQIRKSTVNLLRYEYGLRPACLAAVGATLAFPLLGHRLAETGLQGRVRDAWVQVRENRAGRPLRILSLRGALDPLVSPQMIDACLDLTPWPEALTKVELPKGQHLDGLKIDGDRYQSAVRAFLA